MHILKLGRETHGRDWRALARGATFSDLENTLAQDALQRSGGKEGTLLVLTGDSPLEESTITDALGRQCHVVLASPRVPALPVLERLAARAREKGRVLAFAGAESTASCASHLAGVLGMVGTISHVSFADRRPWTDLPAAQSAVANTDAAQCAQLANVAFGQLVSLCELLKSEPRSVMARLGRPPFTELPVGATTEVFLELHNGLHIQYFGSAASSVAEQELWIDGSRGALRADGKYVWWRKKGWPRFVPIRWHFGSTTPARAGIADNAKRVLAAVHAGGAANRATASLDLLLAVLRSSAERRELPVDPALRQPAAGGPRLISVGGRA
jgi:predicted dehydrogenase